MMPALSRDPGSAVQKKTENTVKGILRELDLGGTEVSTAVPVAFRPSKLAHSAVNFHCPPHYLPHSEYRFTTLSHTRATHVC